MESETNKVETPNDETPAAPEMSTVGLPSKEYIHKGIDKDNFNLKIFEGKN